MNSTFMMSNTATANRPEKRNVGKLAMISKYSAALRGAPAVTCRGWRQSCEVQLAGCYVTSNESSDTPNDADKLRRT